MEFDFSPLQDNWRFLARGLMVTVTLSALAMVCATALGLVVALGRLYGSKPLRIVLTFYIDSMRAIPVLVVLVWTFFAFPLLSGITLAPFWAALVAITAHVAAYIAEIVRAGLLSIRAGQTQAALALGMSRAQVVRTILLPQALVRILPAYGSILTVIIKDTAIATVIATPEFMRQTETVAAQTFRPIEVYTFAMVVFFIILFPVTRIVDLIYRRVAILGQS